MKNMITLARHEMEQVLSGMKLVFMTSGLVIYMTLPPLKFQQFGSHLQMTAKGNNHKILQSNDMLDACIDCDDITGDTAIDYTAHQKTVLRLISDTEMHSVPNSDAQNTLRNIAKTYFDTLSSQS